MNRKRNKSKRRSNRKKHIKKGGDILYIFKFTQFLKAIFYAATTYYTYIDNIVLPTLWLPLVNLYDRFSAIFSYLVYLEPDKRIEKKEIELNGKKFYLDLNDEERCVYHDGGETLYYCIRGTVPRFADLISDYGILTGQDISEGKGDDFFPHPIRYVEEKISFHKYFNENPNIPPYKELIITGHSLGGTMAINIYKNIVLKKEDGTIDDSSIEDDKNNHIKTIVFNPGCGYFCKRDDLSGEIRIHRIFGDIVSEFQNPTEEEGQAVVNIYHCKDPIKDRMIFNLMEGGRRQINRNNIKEYIKIILDTHSMANFIEDSDLMKVDDEFLELKRKTFVPAYKVRNKISTDMSTQGLTKKTFVPAYKRVYKVRTKPNSGINKLLMNPLNDIHELSESDQDVDKELEELSKGVDKVVISKIKEEIKVKAHIDGLTTD